MYALLPALAFAVVIAAHCAAIPAVQAMNLPGGPQPKMPDGPDTIRISQPATTHSALCARRDLKAVILIERVGEARDIPGHELFDAFMTMVRARNACRAGHESEALSIYDAVDSTVERALLTSR